MVKRVSGCAMKLFQYQHLAVSAFHDDGQAHFVILSNIDRGSNMNVGSVTRLKSAPGRSCDIMCMSTVSGSQSWLEKLELWLRRRKKRTAALLRVNDRLILLCNIVG